MHRGWCRKREEMAERERGKEGGRERKRKIPESS